MSHIDRETPEKPDVFDMLAIRTKESEEEANIREDVCEFWERDWKKQERMVVRANLEMVVGGPDESKQNISHQGEQSPDAAVRSDN